MTKAELEAPVLLIACLLRMLIVRSAQLLSQASYDLIWQYQGIESTPATM